MFIILYGWKRKEKECAELKRADGEPCKKQLNIHTKKDVHNAFQRCLFSGAIFFLLIFFAHSCS